MKKHYDFAREELAYYESNGTSLQNLLAVLIGPGAKPEVTGYLSSIGIEKLINISMAELIKLEGIGEVTARRIMSALSLTKHVISYKKDFSKEETVTHPDTVAKIFSDLKFKEFEVFEVLYLSTKNKVLARKEIFKGSLNTCVVHPREIFKEAIRHSAAAIICVHNHPSGIPVPSEEDLLVTERLKEVGEVVGIEVLDHIIIGMNEYHSMKIKGQM